ncbi:MAG: helix-hairpin-helix domain-containing protein [Anaerolineales bacterium]
MSELNRSINPNTADLGELTLLPGVGPTLAQRIEEYRPYSSLEDMKRVPGLSESMLAKMQAMLDIQALKDALPASAGVDKTGLEREGAGKQDTHEKSGTSAYATRSQVLGISAAAAGVGVVVSILLILSILIGINRTLNYSRHAAIRALANDVSQIEVQLKELDNGMAGMDRRLGALEGLSGRMTELEGETADIASEVEAASARVQQMRTRVEEISLQIEELVRQTDHQATFFERLQQLLVEIFGGAVEENGQ